MKLRKKTEKRSGSAAWMTTFSDMTMLILVFFILLFSMSQIDLVKFEAIAESFKKSTLNFDGYPSVIKNPKPSENPKISKSNQENEEEQEENQDNNNQQGGSESDSLQQLMAEVNKFLEENGLTEVISANREERGVVLVLQEKVLFASGNAELLPAAYPFLDKVGTLLNSVPNPIKVEGHTDNRPISTYRFPSNWELSTARAASVVRYLEANHNLEKTRFYVVGYGETRPIVDNTGPENWAKNRRVEIVISDPKYVETISADMPAEMTNDSAEQQ
ncbi:flagellar motor protein MotS [Calidifontibacillus oryziterrae]|uniref:flagellar motor protein MotS n=1 Tax=Calidifontibacillus oryziterrae TaxID=1191699 RepID=UPI000310E94E|nr:flagellar motor protein MotS [Calidifontibacillus oryziterrae]